MPETGEVGRAEPFLAFAVQDVDVAELRREPVGEPAGPVGRVIVDDENTYALPSEGAQHRFDVLPLVVRGEANDGGRHLRIFTSVIADCTLQLSGPAVGQRFRPLDV